MKKHNKEEHNAELNRTLRLLTLTAIRGLPQTEKIKLMNLAGFDRHEIAEFVGTTPLTVSVTISNLKKAQSKKKKRGRK